MKRLVSLRRAAAHRQSHFCYYCHMPMWEKERTTFAQTYRLTDRQARLLQCTAEHLLPRSDGGADTGSNIVAACLFCNRQRHVVQRPLAAAEYKHVVNARMQQGRWLAGMLPTMVATRVSRDVTSQD